MLLLAHRGASADAPENTVAAFREAAAQGADGVELDVMCCGSGELVVCHDEHLGRLARADLWVASTPLWKLQRLDVGTPLGFAPARIPLLEEVVECLPPKFLLNLELKCDTVDDRGLSDALADYVRAAGLVERTVVSSFNSLCLMRVAARAPELRRGFLIDPDKPFLPQDAAALPLSANYSVHPHYTACTPRRVGRWRDGGYQLAVWTVDDSAELLRLRELEVSYCITNRPGAMREALSP